jgi:predicted nucleotidyltransferase
MSTQAGSPTAQPREIPDVIRAIVERLVSQYAPQKVILFGSYASGEPDRDSDIDLLIIKQTRERFLDRWAHVHEVLNGTHPSIPLEPLVLTPQEVRDRLAVGDQFIQEILERGKVLYGA